MFTGTDQTRTLYQPGQPILTKETPGKGPSFLNTFQFAPLTKPTQKVMGTDTEDHRYDFLFPNSSQMVLKLSEMNALNGKKMVEVGQNYPNFTANLKSLSEKIDNSVTSLAELQKKSDDLETKLSCSIEQHLRECVLATKGVYAKARMVSSLLDNLSCECDVFSDSLKIFHESFLRIKNDTKMYYEHPSKPLIAVVSTLKKKVEIICFAMNDLTCVIERQDDFREEESDNLRHYINIVEDLNSYFQIVVKRANDLAAAIKATKARIFGTNIDGTFNIVQPLAQQTQSQLHINKRIHDLMDSLDNPKTI